MDSGTLSLTFDSFALPCLSVPIEGTGRENLGLMSAPLTINIRHGVLEFGMKVTRIGFCSGLTIELD